MELYDKGGTGIHETVYAFVKQHFASYDRFASYDVFSAMRRNGSKLTEDQIRRALYNINRLKNTDLIKIQRAQYRLKKTVDKYQVEC